MAEGLAYCTVRQQLECDIGAYTIEFRYRSGYVDNGDNPDSFIQVSRMVNNIHKEWKNLNINQASWTSDSLPIVTQECIFFVCFHVDSWDRDQRFDIDDVIIV